MGKKANVTPTERKAAKRLFEAPRIENLLG